MGESRTGVRPTYDPTYDLMSVGANGRQGVSITGSKVGIVGGSVAGCAVAYVLSRLGCEVTVFERRAEELRDRAYGIAIPVPLRAELEAAGLLDESLPAMPVAERIWSVADGSRAGRVIARQPFQVAYHRWGMLWAGLRESLAGIDYRTGVSVTAVEPGADSVVLRVADVDGGDDGSAHRFDVVFGADGYRSVVRAVVDDAAEPKYAGYDLWRGGYPIDGVDDLLDDESDFPTICFPGGHGVVVPVPDAVTGHRLTWAIYFRGPADRRSESVAAHRMDESLVDFLFATVDRHFPPYYRDLVRRSDRAELTRQPVFDLIASRMYAGRVALVGDAAAVTRPHSGGGATKALGEALALARICRQSENRSGNRSESRNDSRYDGWDEILARLAAERQPIARELVDLGRRIGAGQVENTPDWSMMNADDFTAWFVNNAQRTTYNSVTKND